MGKHTVLEAENNLNELIDRALAGEGVVITRGGAPVVEIKPCAQGANKRITPEGIRRVANSRQWPAGIREHGGKLISDMRDEAEK